MKKIAQADWDFRDIDEHNLQPAVVYEYCRSSPKILVALKKWFAAGCPPLPGNIDSDHDVPEIVGAICRVLGCVPTKPWTLLTSADRQLIRKAWRWGSHASSVYCHKSDEMPPWFFNDTAEPFYFTVNWHHSDKSILADLKRILAKVRPQPPNRRPGRGAALPFEPLKWLSAYRLAAAGVSFKDAKKLLDRLRVRQYEHHSGWSGAIHKAKVCIARAESGDFGFL